MDQDPQAEIRVEPQSLKEHMAACDTPFLSEQITLPVARNYSEYSGLLCHPGNPLHGGFNIQNGEIYEDNRVGWGSENFFQEASNKNALRRVKTELKYETVDKKYKSVPAVLLVKGPKMEEGVRKGEFSYNWDFEKYQFTAAIVAECPDNPALEGILGIGRIFDSTNKKFLFEANRYPSILRGPENKSGAEIISSILQKKDYDRAASNVNLMSSFTERLRRQVSDEYEYYKNLGDVYSEDKWTCNLDKVKKQYENDRQLTDKPMIDTITRLSISGLINPDQKFVREFGQTSASPLDTDEARALIICYELGTGPFSPSETKEIQKQGLEQLLKMIGSHAVFIGQKTGQATDFIDRTLETRVKKIREFAQLYEKKEDFRADEVRTTLNHNKIMLYPDEFLHKLMAHYYLGSD